MHWKLHRDVCVKVGGLRPHGLEPGVDIDTSEHRSCDVQSGARNDILDDGWNVVGAAEVNSLRLSVLVAQDDGKGGGVIGSVHNKLKDGAREIDNGCSWSKMSAQAVSMRTGLVAPFTASSLCNLNSYRGFWR